MHYPALFRLTNPFALCSSYFPHVCIGMEYLQLNQLELAKESFDLAYEMNALDPLLLNELGVCCYNQQE